MKHFLISYIPKPMQKLTLFFFTVAVSISGCDFVEKVNPFTTKVDTMELYLQRQDSIRSAELIRKQQEEARADSIRRAQETEVEQVKTLNRYHLIVGAFKTPSYAMSFQEKILAQGHDSRIILSDNNFHLVTIRSFDNYNSAVNEWRSIRSQGEHLVWLYIKDL